MSWRSEKDREIEEIEARVGHVAGIQPGWIRKKNKSRRLAWSRFMVWTILYKGGMKQTAIAELYDRDASTVCSGVKRCLQLMELEPVYAADYRRLSGEEECPVKMAETAPAGDSDRCGSCGKMRCNHA